MITQRRPGAGPRFLPAVRCLLAGFLLLLAGTAVAAASLQLAAGADTSGHFTAALLDGRIPEGQASIGVRGPDPFLLSVHLRRSAGLGILGNVILDVDGTVSTAGSGRLALALRANAGPVALRLVAEAASQGNLWLIRGDGAALPRLPGSGFSLGAGATWRVERNLLLVADPVFSSGPSGPRFTLPLEVQLPRHAGGHDLRLKVSGSLSRGGEGNWAAAGAGLRLNRGRAAPWEAWLLFGGNARSAAPGLSFSVREQVGPAGVAAAFSLEPWLVEGNIVDLKLSAGVPVGERRLDLLFRLQAPEGRLEAGASFTVPLGDGPARPR